MQVDAPRRAFEATMAWLLLPGIGLAGAVSVFTSAANAAVQERSTEPEVPDGLFGYTFTVIFVYVLFLSMTLNAALLTFRGPERPLTGVPLRIGLGQLGLYLMLILWIGQLRLEFLGIPVGAIGLIGFLAPIVCVLLSIYVFVQILRRPIARSEGLSIRPAHVVFAVVLSLAGIAAILARWMLPLNPTGENAANWALITLGVPWSIPATVAAWIVEPLLGMSAVVYTERGEWMSLVGGITLSVPVIANIGVLVALGVARLKRRAP